MSTINNFTDIVTGDDDYSINNFTDMVTGDDDYSDDYIDDYWDDEYTEDDWWPAYMGNIQKPFAALSIICSYVICREIVSDLKTRNNRHSLRHHQRILQKSIARALLNVSIGDIIFSFAVFLGQWPIPKGIPWMSRAAGNQLTCNFQGWMRALGYIASPMFSVALNVFSLLLIRYQWTNSKLAKLERKVTIFIWTYSLVLSIIPIPMKAYNADYDVCWLAPSPLACEGEDCTRGLYANYLQYYYSFAHIYTCLIICIVLICVLFCTVRKVEEKNNRRSITSGSIFYRRLVDKLTLTSEENGRYKSSSTPDTFPMGSDKGVDDSNKTKDEEENGVVAGETLGQLQDDTPDAENAIDDSNKTAKEQEENGVIAGETFGQVQGNEPVPKDTQLIEGFNSSLPVSALMSRRGCNTILPSGETVSMHEVDKLQQIRFQEPEGSESKINIADSSIKGLQFMNPERTGSSSRWQNMSGITDVSRDFSRRWQNNSTGFMEARIGSTQRSASIVTSSPYRKSRAVAYQGILYTVAFLAVHFLDAIQIILYRFFYIWSLKMCIVTYMILQPSQGILNFLIFCKRKKQMDTPEGRFMRKILCFCCLCKR